MLSIELGAGFLMFTIPNVISIARILLSFLFLNYWLQGSYSICLFIFIIAGISDFFDGFLARYLKQESRFGKIIDPLADKIMFIICYYSFFLSQILPIWFIFLNLAKEVIFIIFGLYLFLFSREKVEVFFLSKVNTCIHISLIIFVLYKLSGFKYFGEFESLIDPMIFFFVYLASILIIILIILYGRKYVFCKS